MFESSHGQARPPDTELNARLLLDLAEAVILGYPVLVLIGEIPSDERGTDVITSSHFEGLDQQQQKALIEFAIEELNAI